MSKNYSITVTEKEFRHIVDRVAGRTFVRPGEGQLTGQQSLELQFRLEDELKKALADA